MGSNQTSRIGSGAPGRGGRTRLLLPALLVGAALLAGVLAHFSDSPRGRAGEVAAPGSTRMAGEAPAPALFQVAEPTGESRSAVGLAEPPGTGSAALSPRTAELICLDEEGEPLDWFEYVITAAQREPDSGWHTHGADLGWPRFEVPAEPFELSVYCLDYWDLEGVLVDPARVGEQLVITTPRLPLISGRVNRGGAPVAGAAIVLCTGIRSSAETGGTPIPNRRNLERFGTLETNESGAFEGRLMSCERIWVVAFEGGPGGGLAWQELEVPRTSGRLECQLHLPETGTVELHLVDSLPGGRDFEKAELRRGDARVGFERTERADVLVAAGLAEGVWIFDADFIEIGLDSRGRDSRRSSSSGGRRVEVEPGCTTIVRLDPDSPAPARLTGRLQFEAIPSPPEFVLWEVALLTLGADPTVLASQTLDGTADLEFYLPLGVSGAQRLKLVGHLADLSFLELEDLVAIEAGQNYWHGQLPVGRLMGTAGELSRGWQRPLWLRWSGPADLRARVRFAEGFAAERFELGAVPAGSLNLEHFDPERNELVVEGQVYLAAGAEELLRLP